MASQHDSLAQMFAGAMQSPTQPADATATPPAQSSTPPPSSAPPTPPAGESQEALTVNTPPGSSPAETPPAAVDADPAAGLAEFDFDATEGGEGEGERVAAKAGEGAEESATAEGAAGEGDEVDQLAEKIRAGELTVPAEIESAFLKTQRGRNMLQSFKMMRELMEPPTEDGKGGIGVRPTIEGIKQWHSDSTDLVVMEQNFYNGTPEEQRAFFRNWFALDPQTGKPHQGAMRAASEMPSALIEADPTGTYYRAVGDVYFGDLMEKFYEMAQGAPDKKQRLGWANAARAIEQFVFGKARELGEEFAETGKIAQPARTPEQEELERVRRERSEEQRLQQQRDVQARTDVVRKARFERVQGDIDRLLSKPLKGKIHQEVYEAAKGRVFDEAMGAMKRNPTIMAQYNVLFRQAVRTGDPADVAAAARYVQEMARPYLRRFAPDVVRKYLPSIAQTTQERQARAQEASAKVDLPSTGQSAQASDPNEILKQKPGESHSQWVKRRIAAQLAAT